MRFDDSRLRLQDSRTRENTAILLLFGARVAYAWLIMPVDARTVSQKRDQELALKELARALRISGPVSLILISAVNAQEMRFRDSGHTVRMRAATPVRWSSLFLVPFIPP